MNTYTKNTRRRSHEKVLNRTPMKPLLIYPNGISARQTPNACKAESSGPIPVRILWPSGIFDVQTGLPRERCAGRLIGKNSPKTINTNIYVISGPKGERHMLTFNWHARSDFDQSSRFVLDRFPLRRIESDPARFNTRSTIHGDIARLCTA